MWNPYETNPGGGIAVEPAQGPLSTQALKLNTKLLGWGLGVTIPVCILCVFMPFDKATFRQSWSWHFNLGIDSRLSIDRLTCMKLEQLREIINNASKHSSKNGGGKRKKHALQLDAIHPSRYFFPHQKIDLSAEALAFNPKQANALHSPPRKHWMARPWQLPCSRPFKTLYVAKQCKRLSDIEKHKTTKRIGAHGILWHSSWHLGEPPHFVRLAQHALVSCCILSSHAVSGVLFWQRPPSFLFFSFLVEFRLSHWIGVCTPVASEASWVISHSSFVNFSSNLTSIHLVGVGELLSSIPKSAVVHPIQPPNA